MLHRPAARRLTLSALALLLALTAFGSTGCQRGEKSCRYYSLVLVRSDAPDERKRAIEEIKRMGTKDQLKCDDDKVFGRFMELLEDDTFRPMVVDAMENLGKASPKLRDRSEKVLVKAAESDDTAPLAGTIVKNWRVASAEKSGDEAYMPSKEMADALAGALKRAKQGTAKATLLESLFVALPDTKERMKYEDLLIDLAQGDPTLQTIEVNQKAIEYLKLMRSQKDGTFDAYVRGLFVHDAARNEVYQAARLALATISPKEKVVDRIVGIYENKDEKFLAWTKKQDLFDWEFKDGPKLAQVLSDLHHPKSAPAIIARIGSPIDAANPPGSFVTVKKNAAAWGGYLTAPIKLASFGMAAMGKDLAPHAPAIAEVAKNDGLAAEQRTLPAIGLGLSGAPNAWSTLLGLYKELPENTRPEFITALTYALEPQHLAEWDAVVAVDTAEGTQLALKDETIKARVALVRTCAQQVATGQSPEEQLIKLVGCYGGFLKNGDPTQKEKAAVGLVHQLAVGSDAVVVGVLPRILQAFQDSQPTDSTLRQVLLIGLKVVAVPGRYQSPAVLAKVYESIYKTQQIIIGQGNQVWVWEFDIIVDQLKPAIDKLVEGKIGGGGEKAPDGGAAEGGDKPDAPAGE